MLKEFITLPELKFREALLTFCKRQNYMGAGAGGDQWLPELWEGNGVVHNGHKGTFRDAQGMTMFYILTMVVVT